MSSELRMLMGEMRANDQRKTSGNARAKQGIGCWLAVSSPFARNVILVTERCALTRVASQESWVNAGGWIEDGKC
jgi:hypothetical protein